MNKVVHFLLTLLIMFAVSIAPAQALLKGGTWQELNSTTGAVNGTAPLADGATIPLYQGSMLLDPTKTYDIEFTAMPRDFSADASSTSMRAVNSTDTEGDLFTDPPSIAWENQEPPTMSLVWADAATPDTPLSPQPILNQTFCAQNLAGRQLVAWAQVEDENSVPALWLYTRTGVPNSAVIPLLSPKVTLNIKPAVSDPVSVSGDHIDANFAASKVKAGESITLTVSTKACNGDVAPNAAFVIRREDAINRQGVVNNANPVRVGDTELTTTQTEYHGVTDGQGNATVVVTQEQGPGVKTRLIVSSQSYPTLTDNVDVIFTTITSPDSDKANMYGHMLENATATLNGTTYTFTRPKLAAETSGNGGTVVDTNETWAQFTWSGADNHCDILPDAEQLVALRHEHSALATYTGWPVTGDAEYWSSTKDQINDYHAAVHMNSASVVRAANSDTLLVSCVDKAQPAAHPQITLSPEGPYKAQVGESIDLVMTVVDRDTQKPLPYRYMELFIDPAKNRKGEHQDAWDNQRVTINTEDMRASSPEHYTGVTDANGQVHLTLKHDSGLGVETPIRIVMPDDEGGSIELPFSVIFTVITSPDTDKATYWGHMPETFTNSKGVEFARPLLRAELSSTTDTSGYLANGENWYTWSRYPNLYQDSASPCDRLGLPTMDELKTLYADYPQGGLTAAFGLPVAGGKYWGAGDSKVNDTHSTNNFQYIRLNTGDTTTTSANTATAQLCLAKRRVLSIALTSSAMNAEKSAALAKKGEKIPLTVTVTDGAGTPQPNVPIRLGRGSYSQNRAGGNENGSNSDMLLTPIAPPADAKAFAYHYSGEQLWYWYGTTDENGRVQFELTQDNTPGLKTRLEAMLPDNPPTVSDMDAIFTVITSPDSVKAKYWGHMPETVTNSAGVEFRRPLLAAEMTSNSGTYLDNNETWPLVTIANTQKAGATGCDAQYQPLLNDLQTLYGDNPNSAIGTAFGWPVGAGKSWLAVDQETGTGYYQYLRLDTGAKGRSSSTSVTGAQVCLVEPRTSTPASITLTSTAMDGAKNAAVVEKGGAMPLTVTVKDSSGNPVANVGFTLSRGDSKNRAGTVVTDGDVAADAGADDLMLKALTPASASQSMTTTGIVFTGTTGSDGTATFTLNQDKSLGLKTPLTVKLTDNTTLHASLDVIFMVLTSPDTDKALFWGNMADTTSVNGKTLHRPWLQAELLSGVTPVFTNGVHTNNEYWAMAHTVDNTKWDIAKQCGSLSKAPDNNDLLTLYHSISSLGWPTQGYPYLSKSTSSGGMYCGVDENTRSQNCAIKPASSAGYATCVD